MWVNCSHHKIDFSGHFTPNHKRAVLWILLSLVSMRFNGTNLILLVSIASLLSCNQKPKEQNNTVPPSRSMVQEETACLPDYVEYMGYQNIVFHSVQLAATDDLQQKNVIGYSNTLDTKSYYDWRLLGNGCGVVYSFIIMEFENQLTGQVGITTSNISQAHISQVNPNTLMMGKDAWAPKALKQNCNSCVELNTVIHVFDSEYSLASTIKENLRKLMVTKL